MPRRAALRCTLKHPGRIPCMQVTPGEIVAMVVFFCALEITPWMMLLRHQRTVSPLPPDAPQPAGCSPPAAACLPAYLSLLLLLLYPTPPRR